jgi:3-oxoacyl-[acyl-carrier-protein] synthase-3
MAFLEIKNVKIVGISACVPKEIEENLTLPVLSSKEEASKFIESTGIERRHISQKHTTSDLCCSAAEKLISDLGWNKSDIDALIFVTQGPDYILPATSCILQDRLGLSEECYTLDISLGCSGWVYGLSVAAPLLSAGTMKKALLLCGDTSHLTSKADKSAWPLFGETGTATALEFSDKTDSFKFHFATDGSGYDAIIVPDGCWRHPYTKDSLKVAEIEPGIRRAPKNTIINGMDVFVFGISKAPQTMKRLAERFAFNLEDIDYFVLHQANMFMNEKIRKKLKLPEEKFLYSLKNFGNTSSASIPLTIVTEIPKEAATERHSFVGCGFGVGLSWASVLFELDRTVCSELVEI